MSDKKKKISQIVDAMTVGSLASEHIRAFGSESMEMAIHNLHTRPATTRLAAYLFVGFFTNLKDNGSNHHATLFIKDRLMQALRKLDRTDDNASVYDYMEHLFDEYKFESDD